MYINVVHLMSDAQIYCNCIPLLTKRLVDADFCHLIGSADITYLLLNYADIILGQADDDVTKAHPHSVNQPHSLNASACRKYVLLARSSSTWPQRSLFT